MSIMGIRGNNDTNYYLDAFEERFKSAHKAKELAKKEFKKFSIHEFEKFLRMQEKHLHIKLGQEFGYPNKSMRARLEDLSKRIDKIIKISSNSQREDVSKQIKELNTRALDVERAEKTFIEKESECEALEAAINEENFKDVSVDIYEIIEEELDPNEVNYREINSIHCSFLEKFNSLELKIKKLEFINAPRNLIDELVKEQEELEKKLVYDIVNIESNKIAKQHNESVLMGENLQSKIRTDFHKEKCNIIKQVKAEFQNAEENEIKREVVKRLREQWIEPKFKEAKENYEFWIAKRGKLFKKLLDLKLTNDFDPKDEKYLELELNMQRLNEILRPLREVYVTMEDLQETLAEDFELSEFDTGLSKQIMNFLMRIVELIKSLFN